MNEVASVAARPPDHGDAECDGLSTPPGRATRDAQAHTRSLAHHDRCGVPFEAGRSHPPARLKPAPERPTDDGTAPLRPAGLPPANAADTCRTSASKC